MIHRHEWNIKTGSNAWVIMCHCGKIMSWDEVENRLNATEFLTASMADSGASLIRNHIAKDHLKNYAKALKGQD